MGTKVNVKGVDIDILSPEQMDAKIKEYLANDYLNIIFLVSQEMLNRAEREESFRETLSKVDLRLPEKKEIFENQMALAALGEVVTDYSQIEDAVKDARESRRSIYLVGDREEKMKKFMDYCKEHYSKLSMAGAFCINPELGPEPVINEINVANPDIIFTIMESPMQEEWIVENFIKINARLCISIGSIVDEITEGRRGIPRILDGVRHLLKKKKPEI